MNPEDTINPIENSSQNVTNQSEFMPENSFGQNPVPPTTTHSFTNTPPTPPPGSATKGISRMILIVLGIGVILASALAAFFFMQNQNLKKQMFTMQETKLPEETQPPLPTATPDPMADWETYTNTEYGFAFKYPGHLSIDCCRIAGPDSVDQPTITLADPDTILEGTDKPFDGFSIFIKSDVSTFENYIDESKQTLLENFDPGGNSVPINPLQSPITLANQQGVKLTGYKPLSDTEFYFVPLPRGNTVIVLGKTDGTEDSFEETFQQILSTFQFIEPSSPASNFNLNGE